MIKIVLRAVVPYIIAFIAAYFATSLVFATKAKKRINTPPCNKGARNEKIGVMDIVLIVEAVAIVLYVIADFLVFWHTGAEPSTLTMSFFAVCGGENGWMAWIKTRKEQERMRKWQLEDQNETDKIHEDNSL